MPRPPSLGSVSSPYGMRINPNDGTYRMHYGEDTLGTGNYATATGTVVYAGYDKTGTGLGWAVGIRETMNPTVIWWIAHHGSTSLWNPLKVAVGSKVSEGFTYLGPKGDTGAAKGVHAHTERRVGGAASPGSGTPTNPRSFYTGTGGAGGGGTEIPPQQRKRNDDMPALIKRDTTPPEWSLIHPALRGPSDLERGYIVTADPVQGIWWARFYADGSGSEDVYARDDYVAAQAAARADAPAWQTAPLDPAVVAAYIREQLGETIDAALDGDQEALRELIETVGAKTTADVKAAIPRAWVAAP